MEPAARGFASSIEQPRDNFQIGVGEALLFSNSEKISKQYLTDAGDGLIAAMKKAPDDKERIDLAVRSVFSRPPTSAEIDILGGFLRQREDRPADAYRQMVWALLASTEFRFNH